MAVTLEKLAPPNDLTDPEQNTLFQYIFRRLAAYRNAAQLHALAEYHLSTTPEREKQWRKNMFSKNLNEWAQDLCYQAYMVCGQPSGDECPVLDELSDTSIGDLPEISHQRLASVLNAVLFLSITSKKEYSARTRSFLFSNRFPDDAVPDEELIATTLKHPEQALQEAQQKAEASTKDHASRNKTLRMVGMGLGALTGGALVAITGGLAAPLVGASFTAVLGWLGVGGTAAGLLASGLAGSSAVCAAVFGAYGAKSASTMVQRHTREIRDLAIVPVSSKKDGDETLGVRLCVSGWLASEADVTAPWTVFGGDETLALRWEVKALEELSDALYTLIKTNAMKYVRVEIIRHTVFAALMASLAPIALLKIGEIIDNPWMNTRALALKAGAVLGDLLSKRVFGNRPVTLIGYSFGSLVILEALRRVASLPPSETSHLIQDVYLFGTPASTDPTVWSSVRRLVAGRVVNGYSSKDYVLAVLSRASSGSWKVAGLHPVDVQGVENVHFDEIDGHTSWRERIGQCLKDVGAPKINDDEVKAQLKAVIEERSTEEAQEAVEEGM